MKRIMLATLIAVLALPTVAMAARVKPDPGEKTETRYKGEQRKQAAPRERFDRRENQTQPVVRERAVVRPGFPIHREPPRVVIRRHPAPVNVRIVYSSAPVIWRGVAMGRPYRDRWAWEDSEVLRRWEGWADVVLDVNGVGGSLYLELSGPTQLDFAEVVLSNGRARVVDFRQRTLRNGIYELMDFRGPVRVDYVRLVARAMAPSVRVSVQMAR
jgi:hypothetical protein